MHLAVENKKNDIGFYKIDGRYLNKFIDKAKRDIEYLRCIWRYDKLKNGVFVNAKTIFNNNNN